jgi:small subunit ribosomal protein S16
VERRSLSLDCAADRRFARDGRFIEQVGTYDPKKDPVEVKFKEEKAING